MSDQAQKKIVRCKNCNGFLCYVSVNPGKEFPIGELGAISKLCCPKCKKQNSFPITVKIAESELEPE